jgi:probable F420-dependent oxidoreductase
MTQRTVRVGVTVRPQHTTMEKMRETWHEAEEIGADDVFIWDHFFPLFGDPDGPHFECWTSLAALAEVTSRVRIGPLVSAIGYRNPNLIADMARTIDHISGGRFILGLGSGWNEKDYREYGYDFKTAIARLYDLRDSLPVIKERLASLNPPAVQNPMPILIGGSGEKVTLRIVAEHADMWNGFGDPREAGRLSGVLDDWCRSIGRDPAQIERSILAGAQKVVANADDYVRNGITTLTVGVDGPGKGLDVLRDLVAWRDSR